MLIEFGRKDTAFFANNRVFRLLFLYKVVRMGCSGAKKYKKNDHSLLQKYLCVNLRYKLHEN